MTIKKIEDLKNIQIICKNQKQVKDCFKYLRKLGYYDYYKEDKYYFDNDLFVNFYKDFWFYAGSHNDTTKKLEFYDKNFVKTLQKFIKENKEKKEVKDFEVAEDDRVIKINNFTSEKEIFICTSMCTSMKGDKIKELKPTWLEYVVKLGLVYVTQEARDRAMFKLEIETKLKNIAERLNKGRKIDWNDEKQDKFGIYYDYNDKRLDLFVRYYCRNQGVIYCLDENFLEVAKQEIGEKDLIKYFKEE